MTTALDTNETTAARLNRLRGAENALNNGACLTDGQGYAAAYALQTLLDRHEEDTDPRLDAPVCKWDGERWPCGVVEGLVGTDDDEYLDPTPSEED